MSEIEVKEFKPKFGPRKHAITLAVYTDNREAMSTIPNPRSYADEGGPEWVMRYGSTTRHRYEIAALLSSYEYLLSPDYTMADATKRLRELRRAYREAMHTGETQ